MAEKEELEVVRDEDVLEDRDEDSEVFRLWDFVVPLAARDGAAVCAFCFVGSVLCEIPSTSFVRSNLLAMPDGLLVAPEMVPGGIMPERAFVRDKLISLKLPAWVGIRLLYAGRDSICANVSHV